MEEMKPSDRVKLTEDRRIQTAAQKAWERNKWVETHRTETHIHYIGPDGSTKKEKI